MVDLNDNLGYVPVVRIETSDGAIGGNETNQPNKALKELASRDAAILDLLGGDDATAQATVQAFQQIAVATTAQGRLTLSAGTPVPSSDVTAATTLYYTPYNGDYIAIYSTANTRWDLFQFTERSLSLSGFVANTLYDIFIYDNSGLTLEAVAWTTSTAGTSSRAQAISQLNGVWVKSSDNRRYLGTIQITGTTGQCEDSKVSRFVWNVQNQVRRIIVSEDNVFHSYTSSTVRPVNNNTLHRLNVCPGLETSVRVTHVGNGNSDTTNVDLWVGVNSFSVGSRQGFGNNDSGTGLNPSTLIAIHAVDLPVGFNYLAALQSGAGNGSFSGSGITMEWSA